MKKLLTILAASAMFFAFGEDVDQGADFEAYTKTGEESFNPNEDTDPNGSRYWYSASSVGNVISNHVAGALEGVSVPDMFGEDTSNTNFLYLETEAPLFRTVKPTGKLTPDDGVEFGGFSIADKAIYLDTLVKFTAADSAFTSFEDAADKIAIEYVEHEEESHEDPELGLVIDSAGFTNFVIRAGYLSSPLSQTNYYAAVPADFNKDAWHRLTVRSFGSIDAANHVGFVVYLDGEPLAAEAVDLGNGVVTPTVISPAPSYEASGAAAAFYETGSLCALFPSAVQGGDNQYEISAVAFSGNGSVDDVVFTTDMPKFIKDGESVRTEITLGTGITGVTVTVGENEIDPLDATATPLVFNLPAGTTAFVLGVTADSANGYTFDETTGITPTDVTYDAATDTVTITGTNPALTLVGKRDNVTYIDGEGNPQSSPSLATAIAGAGNNTTITLAYNIDANAIEGSGFKGYTITGKTVTLDLNGKSIIAEDKAEEALFTINPGAKLIVIDSSSANTGIINYDTEYAVFYADGDCEVGATSGDYGPKIIGPLVDPEDESAVTVIRGKLDGDGNSTSGAFNRGDYVSSGSEVSSALVDGFWVVTPKGVLGTYTVTVTPTANATYAAAYKVGGEAITPANDVLTVTVGQTIVITATPAANYEYAEVPTGWTAGQDGKITIEVSAAGTVAIPVPSEKMLGTYQVTVTPTANATYAAAYNDGGAAVEFVNDVAAVTVGKTITITATPGSGYEYAETPTGWTAGQDGKITIEVSAEATVAIPAPTAKSSYPSYITGHDDYKDEYDTWAQTYGADTGSAYEAAFLLNIAPDAEDQTLKPTAITMEGGKVVITANQTLTSVNGKVYVKVATTLAGLSTAEWAEATLSEGKVQVTPGSSDTAGFYKIKVDF